MIELSFLEEDLVAVLRWQLANPGRHDGPEVPWAGARIWGIFLRLHESRSIGGFGPAAITYQDIEAFQRFTGEPVRPWEVDIIKTLDSEYMRHVNSDRPKIKTEQIESRQMTPALFDAIFS